MIEEYVCVFTFVFVRLFFGEPCYILSESVKPVFSRYLIARFVRGCNYYPRDRIVDPDRVVCFFVVFIYICSRKKCFSIQTRF